MQQHNNIGDHSTISTSEVLRNDERDIDPALESSSPRKERWYYNRGVAHSAAII